MKLFVCFALLCVGAFATTTRWHQLEPMGYNFEHFKTEFKRTYTGVEHQVRERVFNTNLEKILAHNADSTQTWKMGVNQFTDQTQEERKMLNGYKPSMKAHTTFTGQTFEEHKASVNFKSREGQGVAPNGDVDWRLFGAVTAVKDQGHCGSCWTFAATETMESAWFFHTGELINLSEQQIASCTPNPQSCGGTGGCEGGTAELAFQQAIDAGGIASEWVYPYVSYDGTDYPCKNATKPYATIDSYVQLPTNDYNSLMEAISTSGPISISVDASVWHAYESGVFNGCNNTNPDIDHAVQLVGVGHDASLNMDYWLIRNSWSPAWGEKGYLRVWRQGKQHTCGTDLTPGDGVACKPYPKTQEACGTCGILVDSSFATFGK